MKTIFKLNAFVVAMILIILSTNLFGKCNKETETPTSTASYALTLNSNPTYTLKAYTNATLTTPVADLNKINKDNTIYIIVPKPRAENTTVQVSGADKVADTVATVKMTGNKTITAAYTLDTANFKYILNTTSCNVWGYTGTAKNIEIPVTIKGIPVDTIGAIKASSSSFTTLQSVIIPYGVKTIYNLTFAYCANLERVTIPNSVTYIGDQAFQNCSKLNYVIIPSSVQTIGVFAFYLCSALDNVRVEALTPPVLEKDPLNNYSTFADGIGSTLPELTISVPSSSLVAYQSQWTDQKLIYNTSKKKSRPGVKWVGY